MASVQRRHGASEHSPNACGAGRLPLLLQRLCTFAKRPDGDNVAGKPSPWPSSSYRLVENRLRSQRGFGR